MPRVVKEYAVRRDEILDAAQRLIYSVGYERMTIRDILDDLQISNGAFYHYFVSKQALLEALVERMMDTIEQITHPILHDPHLTACNKLQALFETASRWETEQKALILPLLRVWYRDDNAIVRERVRAMSIKRVAPLFTTIIRQGNQEGGFSVSNPDEVGELVVTLIQGMEQAIAELLLTMDANTDAQFRIESVIAAYTIALERVLGAPTNSLYLVDAETMQEWISSASDNA